MTNSPVLIRPFCSADAEQVAKLWSVALPSSQVWNEPRRVMQRKMRARDDLFYVAVCDDVVIGTVLVGYDGVRGWLYALSVAETFRRQGIGRQLVDRAEHVLRQMGCDKVNLQVRHDNSAVLDFYRQCGYEAEDRISMGKVLLTATSEKAVDPVPVIEVNDSLRLTPVEPADQPSYVKYLNQTEAFMLGTRALPFPYHPLDAEAWIATVVPAETDFHRRRDWAIRHSDGELIGAVGLFGMDRGEKSEIGYWMGQPFWGRGWMTEVVTTLCSAAFATYDLRRIFGQVFSTNPASQRVLEKSGFTREGVLRNHHFAGDPPLDVLVYGLLR